MKQSYTPVEVAKLSDRQVIRILNGHPVRVKHGGHHQMHLSSEQHKKLMRAHKKGSAITLILDPFQIEGHQHLRGAGFGKMLKGASKHLVKHAKKELKHHLPKAKEFALKHAHDAIEKYADEAEDKLQGDGFKSLMKGASKHLVKHAKKEAMKHLPKAKEFALKHAHEAIEKYADEAENHLQEGQGIGRFFKKAKKGLKSVGHALAPIGRAVAPIAKEFGKQLLNQGIQMGEQALLTGAMGGLGVHHRRAHYKKAGRPRKDKRGSGALMPAGSGFAGIKWEDSD
jgi:hypothetical protein